MERRIESLEKKKTVAVTVTNYYKFQLRIWLCGSPT